MTAFQGIIQKSLKLKSIKLVEEVSSNPDCECLIYQSENRYIFAKICSIEKSRELCHGEYTSLQAFRKLNLLRVPEPILVIDTDKSTILITEFIQFSPLRKLQAKLGQLLAETHLHNITHLKKGSEDAVRSFGFSSTVSCGLIPIDNTWNDNWIDFFSNQRIQPQVDMVMKKTGNKEVLDLWIQIKPNINKMFENIIVLPSLLHGDLWSGNTGETDREPVVFDPASFYGHSEFDLAIAGIFGGFNSQFYNSYFEVIPKEPGYEGRQLLYQLFHYLNHWNLFGGSYRRQSLEVLKEIVKTLELL